MKLTNFYKQKYIKLILISSLILLLSSCFGDNKNIDNNVNTSVNYSLDSENNLNNISKKTEPANNNFDNNIIEEETKSENISNNINTNANKQETIKIANYKDIISTCDSMCKVDKVNYCTENQEVVLENLKTVYGSCRSLAKHIPEFNKCKSFCSSYGKEKGCEFSDGSRDLRCEGE